MNKQQKVNNIARKMGTILSTAGIKMIRSAFHLNPVEVGSEELRAFLKDISGDKYVTLCDSKYYLIPWEQWKAIIEVDWTDKKKYLKQKYDCDNFAFSFASRMSEIFDINSAGVVHGAVNIGHFWNGIVTKGEEGLEFYTYDSMREMWAKYEKGHPIIIQGWHYKPSSYRFF